MKRKIIDNKWKRKYKKAPEDNISKSDTSFTFAGVYEELYDEISKRWNDDTKEKYDSEMNNIILPHIKNHNSKIISDYSLQDCEEILEGINNTGFIRMKKKKKYCETRIKHFIYLIHLVFERATKKGYCEDFLWGTRFAERKTEEELFLELRKISKKSLSVEEEKKLLKKIMVDPMEDGKLLTLLLMFALGLRDAEACGLDYGHIHELPRHPGCYIAIIMQTTTDKRNEVKTGGKTDNSARKVLIPSLVRDFLLKRKEIIIKQIEENNLKIDINRFPVCFLGSLDDLPNHSRPITRDISAEARKIYKEIGINPKVLAKAEYEMDADIKRTVVKEKNVTAYLLRRNYATVLKILIPDKTDIKYLMGHELDNLSKERADYTDDKLFELYQLLEKRPLLCEKQSKCVCLETDTETYFSGNKMVNINIDTEKIRVEIYAAEKRILC